MSMRRNQRKEQLTELDERIRGSISNSPKQEKQHGEKRQRKSSDQTSMSMDDFILSRDTYGIESPSARGKHFYMSSSGSEKDVEYYQREVNEIDSGSYHLSTTIATSPRSNERKPNQRMITFDSPTHTRQRSPSATSATFKRFSGGVHRTPPSKLQPRKTPEKRDTDSADKKEKTKEYRISKKTK